MTSQYCSPSSLVDLVNGVKFDGGTYPSLQAKTNYEMRVGNPISRVIKNTKNFFILKLDRTVCYYNIFIDEDGVSDKKGFTLNIIGKPSRFSFTTTQLMDTSKENIERSYRDPSSRHKIRFLQRSYMYQVYGYKTGFLFDVDLPFILNLARFDQNLRIAPSSITPSPISFPYLQLEESNRCVVSVATTSSTGVGPSFVPENPQRLGHIYRPVSPGRYTFDQVRGNGKMKLTDLTLLDSRIALLYYLDTPATIYDFYFESCSDVLTYTKGIDFINGIFPTAEGKDSSQTEVKLPPSNAFEKIERHLLDFDASGTNKCRLQPLPSQIGELPFSIFESNRNDALFIRRDDTSKKRGKGTIQIKESSSMPRYVDFRLTGQGMFNMIKHEKVASGFLFNMLANMCSIHDDKYLYDCMPNYESNDMSEKYEPEVKRRLTKLDATTRQFATTNKLYGLFNEKDLKSLVKFDKYFPTPTSILSDTNCGFFTCAHNDYRDDVASRMNKNDYLLDAWKNRQTPVYSCYGEIADNEMGAHKRYTYGSGEEGGTTSSSPDLQDVGIFPPILSLKSFKHISCWQNIGHIGNGQTWYLLIDQPPKKDWGPIVDAPFLHAFKQKHERGPNIQFTEEEMQQFSHIVFHKDCYVTIRVNANEFIYQQADSSLFQWSGPEDDSYRLVWSYPHVFDDIVRKGPLKNVVKFLTLHFSGNNYNEYTYDLLYHQTSKDIIPWIWTTGFTPSKEGWAGPGVYMAYTDAITCRKIGKATQRLGSQKNNGIIRVFSRRKNTYDWTAAFRLPMPGDSDYKTYVDNQKGQCRNQRDLLFVRSSYDSTSGISTFTINIRYRSIHLRAGDQIQVAQSLPDYVNLGQFTVHGVSYVPMAATHIHGAFPLNVEITAHTYPRITSNISYGQILQHGAFFGLCLQEMSSETSTAVAFGYNTFFINRVEFDRETLLDGMEQEQEYSDSSNPGKRLFLPPNVVDRMHLSTLSRTYVVVKEYSQVSERNVETFYSPMLRRSHTYPHEVTNPYYDTIQINHMIDSCQNELVFKYGGNQVLPLYYASDYLESIDISKGKEVFVIKDLEGTELSKVTSISAK